MTFVCTLEFCCRGSYSSGNAAAAAAAAGRRACIFDYLFKGKLLNLNLKLIGFDVYYSESGARVTRVLALSSGWHKETRVDGRAF
jgi:hypothetical protein